MPEIIERVLTGEEVTLTRHGVPVAVVVRPDALKLRRAGALLTAAASIHDTIAQGARSRLPDGTGITSERADALVEHVRDARSRG